MTLPNLPDVSNGLHAEHAPVLIEIRDRVTSNYPHDAVAVSTKLLATFIEAALQSIALSRIKPDQSMADRARQVLAAEMFATDRYGSNFIEDGGDLSVNSAIVIRAMLSFSGEMNFRAARAARELAEEVASGREPDAWLVEVTKHGKSAIYPGYMSKSKGPATAKAKQLTGHGDWQRAVAVPVTIIRKERNDG